MADQTTESILFEIKINGEQYKAEQKLIRDSLGQLALDIEKTRASQKSLNDERKAGKLTDQQYAEQSVKLREQLKGQLADQRELEKGLATSQKAYQSAAGSVEQLRASLAEAKTAFYAMSEAERQSAEGQALQKQALAISDALSGIEKSVGTASRDVGKYSDGFKQGLAGIVAELAKAQAAQQGFTEGSEEAARNQIRVNGFQTAAQRAAAQAGITDFTQAKAVIDQYTAAFTPAVENLVRVQQEQQQVGQTVGENSQQYQELGFKMAGAQKVLDDLVSAQVAAEKAAQGGAAAAQQQATATTAAAGSLTALRQQLVQLLETRESLDPTTHAAQELNVQILELRTNIQQAEGKIDSFGERIQKNIKKESFDTVTDAIQGMAGAMSIANLVFGDNTDASVAEAKALQLMTIAQNARAIAIGIDSAKEAAFIILLKAKNLFLKEEATLTAVATGSTEAQAAAVATNAEAQAAGAEATVASTVATEAQVVATEGATIAQQALNVALRLNPIGLVIIAVAALVSLFALYRNASDATQKKIRDITEAFLRFTNPIGLVYTGIEALYTKFASVRAVLDPLIDTFNKVAGVVKADAIAFAQYIGLLDTAAEKAAKLAAAELERATALREQADAEIKLAEATGASTRELTQQKLAEIAKQLKAAEANDAAQQALHKEDLKRIAEKITAGKELSKKDKETLEEVAKASATLTELRTQQASTVAEAVERDRTARQQEAADIQTNAQRAVQNLTRRIEQQDAAENAQLQRRVARLDLQLGVVQKGTVQELRLQQQKVQAQAALEEKQATDTLAEKTRLRAVGYAQELASLKQQQQQALDAQGLTEQQKTEITADYAQKRVEVEQKYSLVAARQAVAQLPLLRMQSNAAQLKLEEDFQRRINAVILAGQVEVNKEQLAKMSENTVARRDLELQVIAQEQELAIAGLDKQAMSNYEYETKVTAIRADATAKRKALSEQDTQQVISDLGVQQQAAELNQQLLLAGLSERKQLEVKATQQYAKERVRAEGDSYAAQLAATKEGTTERENVEKQHLINLKNLNQEAEANELANVKAKYTKYAELASSALSSLGTIQDAASQQQLNRIDKEMNAATTSTARKAVLAKQEERINQQQHERQKQYAKAQAVIDLGSAIMRILADTPKADFGVATAIEIALAGVTAAAQFRAIDSQKFASGGIAYGPSHAQGGIQLYRRGQHAGIEIEGGEPVLTANVSKSPLLLSMASMVNQLAGGRALYRDPTPAATWARYAEGGVVSSSAMYLPQVRTGGVVQASATIPIDYDLLTERLTGAFTAAARALPAPQTNLTELREKNRQFDQRVSQTDI